MPFAPGTFGSAVGLALWAVLPPTLSSQLFAIVLVFTAGTWASSVTERHVRSTDPGIVVIDEVLGMLVTLLSNPVGWTGATLGFFLFRAFDVVKPYPANQFERLRGGFGIMADDAMAGVYANMALRLMLLLTPAGLL